MPNTTFTSSLPLLHLLFLLTSLSSLVLYLAGFLNFFTSLISFSCSLPQSSRFLDFLTCSTYPISTSHHLGLLMPLYLLLVSDTIYNNDGAGSSMEWQKSQKQQQQQLYVKDRGALSHPQPRQRSFDNSGKPAALLQLLGRAKLTMETTSNRTAGRTTSRNQTCSPQSVWSRIPTTQTKTLIEDRLTR